MSAIGANGGVRRCRRCGGAGHFAKTCRFRADWMPVEHMRWRCFCLAWGQIGLAVVLEDVRSHIAEASADAADSLAHACGVRL